MSGGLGCGRSLAFPRPTDSVRILRPLALQLVSVEFSAHGILGLLCFQVEFQRAVLETPGLDLEVALMSRNRPGDGVVVLFERHREGYVILAAQVGDAIPCARERVLRRFLCLAEHQACHTEHEQRSADREHPFHCDLLQSPILMVHAIHSRCRATTLLTHPDRWKFHWCLRATMGSTLDALRAGK